MFTLASDTRNVSKFISFIRTRPQHITKHKPTTCHVVGTDDELSSKISHHITELLYDRRFCFQQTWQTGDYMIADNNEVSILALFRKFA